MSHRISLLFLPLLLTLGACNSYEKILKSNDLSYRLTKANEYYDRKKFQQANEIYASLVPLMKGTRNFEPLYFKYAYSYFNLKDYPQASYHFKNFVDFFPGSKDAEECEYMHAFCLYKMAPKASLEQTNTIKALEALQSFINTHPDSKKYVTEANSLMDEGRARLEEKDADAAKLYFDIGQHRAASVAYRNLLRQYPESAQADFYQYMIVRSLYLYARQSIQEKQEERYASAVNAYREMTDVYPASGFLKEAGRYSVLSGDAIVSLRKKNP